jgi:hypothetical protein
MSVDNKVRHGITKFWDASRLFGFIEESTPGRIAPRYFYNVESIVPDGLFRRMLYCQPGVLVTFKVVPHVDRQGKKSTKAVEVTPEFTADDEWNEDYREVSTVNNVLRVGNGKVGTVFLQRRDGDIAALSFPDCHGELCNRWDDLQPGDVIEHGIDKSLRGRAARATHAEILVTVSQ